MSNDDVLSEIHFHYTRSSLQNVGGSSGNHAMTQQMSSRLGAAGGIQTMSDMDSTIISPTMRARETLYALQDFVASKLKRGSMMFNDMAYYVTDDRPFPLDNRGNVLAQVIHYSSPCIDSVHEQTRLALKSDPSGFIIRLFSSELSLQELRDFVDGIAVNHITSLRNQLGNQLFVFTQLPPSHMENFMQMGDSQRRKALQSARFSFTMKPFHSTTSMSNIYGSHLNDFRKRFDRFFNHPEWFRKHGQKYCMGVLLFGPPGTGKTTLIKGLADETHRHPFCVKFSKYTTISEVDHFFYNPMIEVQIMGPNGQMTSQMLQIPLSQRLVIMEDIDAMAGHLFLRRDLDLTSVHVNEAGEVVAIHDGVVMPKSTPQPPPPPPPAAPPVRRPIGLDLNQTQTMGMPPMRTISAWETGMGNQKPQTLESCMDEYLQYFADMSYMLNLFDGITELKDFLFMMSSNQPWKIDPAFLRPGRTDVLVHISYAQADLASSIFRNFFDLEEVDATSCRCPTSGEVFSFDGFAKLATPADINSVCHRCMLDCHKAYALLMSPGLHLEGTHVEEVEKYRIQAKRDRRKRAREQASMLSGMSDGESDEDEEVVVKRSKPPVVQPPPVVEEEPLLVSSPFQFHQLPSLG